MGFETKNLSFKYGNRLILDKISFNLQDGQILALLGPNGTGKTTLIKALTGTHAPFEGECYLNGEDLLRMNERQKSRKVAYVPQNTNSAFPVRVVDAVMIGRKPYQYFSESDEDERIVFETIQKLELSEFAFEYINNLSGGERQRVFIARALCQEPSLLLLDEPTSSLDLKNQLRTMKMVRELVDEKRLIAIMSIHDINLAAMYCDQALMLRDGHIQAQGPVSTVVTAENIRRVYGVDSYVNTMDNLQHMRLKKI